MNINKIITNYFNLYLQCNEFFKSNYINRKKIRFFLRRIYSSKAIIKHNNSKAIITLYIMNLGDKLLYEKYKEAKNLLKKIFSIYLTMYRYFKLKRFLILYAQVIGLKNKESIKTNIAKVHELNFIINKYLLHSSNIIKVFYKHLRIVRKYQYLYFLTKFKLNKNFFLSKLSNKLSKIFNKKVEFNLINLKSLTSNTDIFTSMLSLKLRKRKTSNVLKNIITIINKGKLPSISIHNKETIEKKLEIKDTINLSKIAKLFYSEKNNEYKSKRNKIIFNSIEYKNLNGIKLEVKGRLTKRYRADRSIYKFYSKGSLNNLDSSLKNLSSVVFRGHLNSNLAYSIAKSKRRIGAFAVKG
jgi:hypothetical protein